MAEQTPTQNFISSAKQHITECVVLYIKVSLGQFYLLIAIGTVVLIALLMIGCTVGIVSMLDTPTAYGTM